MSFFVSSHVQILFKGWKVSNAWEMVGSCVAVILIAVFYETLKSYKVHHRKPCKEKSESTPLLRQRNQDQPRYTMWDHIQKTRLYMFQFIVGYFLMLVAMTYNVWLFLAVVGGCGVGYYLVDPYMERYFAQRKQPAVYHNRDSMDTTVTL